MAELAAHARRDAPPGAPAPLHEPRAAARGLLARDVGVHRAGGAVLRRPVRHLHRLPHAVPGRLLRGQPPPELEDRLLQHAGADRLEPDDGDGRLLGGDREEEPRGRLHPRHDPARLGLPRASSTSSTARRSGPASATARTRAASCPGARFDASALHLEGAEAGHAQIFFSLYFAMTGLHALHMIIGVPILLTIAFMRLARPLQPRVPHAGRARGALLALRRHRLDLPVPAALPDRVALTEPQPPRRLLEGLPRGLPRARAC